MKKLIAFFLLLSTYTFAQDGKGKITGTITDAASKEVVEFATVALVTADGKTIDGAVADIKGKFTLNKIAPGNYKLVVSFVGFETKTVDVEISDKKTQVDMNIVISSETQVLNEVVVEGQRSLIEERVDRTIYNAENDATTRGGDATDVLMRVPMLSVDLDGNVSLRGSSNITVLINNKPSTIMAANIGDALKQIPADQIKSVEVITSPSAKYDAEGSSGIINIITKKNTLEGASLNINSGVGNRGANLGLNGNYRRKNMGFSLGGWGRANYNVLGSFENVQTTRQGLGGAPTINTQTADTRNRGLFGNYTLGWDYDIDDKNSILVSARFGARNFINRQNNLLTVVENENGSSSSLRNAYTEDLSNSVDLSLTYTRLFDKPQREFSIIGNYSVNDRNNDFENIIRQVNGVDNPSGIRNINDNYNKEMTIQADYQTPIAGNQMLEFGAKDIMRRVYSDFTYSIDPDGSGVYVPSGNTALSNNLNYDQNIVAGYLSYTYTTNNALSVKAGGRYEYTTINAYSQTEDNIDIPNYGAFVPSINISKRLNSGKTIKASYNRRIQRPSIRFLNPTIQAANPYDITIGNPQLDPEFSNNFELSYSTFVKSTNINVAAFWRNTNNGIQSLRDVIGLVDTDPDTVRTTYRNIGHEDAVGLNLSINVMMGNFTLSGGGDVYYSMLDNNLPINPSDPEDPNRQFSASNSGWVASGRFFGSYKLSKGWGVQFFSFYRGRQVQLQGFQGGMGMYNLGLRKEFANKKGTLGVGAQNFFATEMKIRSELNSPLASRKSINNIRNTGVNVTFTYQIGKMSVEPRNRRRRSINNDDLKDGSGMDMGGGMNEAQQPTTNGGGMQRGAMPQQTTRAQVPTVIAPTDTIYEAAGTWVYTVEGGQPGSGGKLTIVKDGESYSGSIKNDRMPQEIQLSKVTVEGNNITFAYTMSFGGNEVVVDCTAVVIENELTGTMNFGQFRSMPIKATRE
ncbi:MAG: TonB-dependent receptor [Cyclobacteriaceae bacterium]|nr:TonB-dependent receptor [Cyclobacteriaceae bacterium]